MIQTNDLSKIGFSFYQELFLDDNHKLQLQSKMNFKNSVYAIFIDGCLYYIGKTNNFKKRFDTYRNCINWISCRSNNRLKTQLLIEALFQNRKIEIWYKEAIFSEKFKDFQDEELLVSSLLEEEKRMIKKFSPKWNIHHNSQ